MTYWQHMINLHKVCSFQTREGKKVGVASNSEFKRWLKNQAIRVQGVPVKWDDVVIFPLLSLTLFTNKKKVTII